MPFVLSKVPTVESDVEITHPGRAAQSLHFRFKFLTNTEFSAWMANADGRPAAQWLGEVIEGWDDVFDGDGEDATPIPYTPEALASLFDLFPNAASEVVAGYVQARHGAQSGN